MEQDFDFQILCLSSTSYRAYPNPPYIEILKKETRPYKCLLLETHYDYYICIPFRTNIGHNYCFLTRSSERTEEGNTGLDYTKMVVIQKSEFLDSETAVIGHDEYVKVIKNLDRIKRDSLQYLEQYCNHHRGISVLSSREYRKYRYSPLKYFHKELGI